ncbi:MAG: SulP family inorganic anion transporter [Anaerolineae bacterium]|nr:SulP family inorganic anion transporter [Anaerolineae bacterium]
MQTQVNTITHTFGSRAKESLRYFAQPAALVREYRLSDIRPDFIAGLTLAVIALPQAIAYALIAELPPEMGLYTAIVAAIAGALWGSSRFLHTGPTNTSALLLLSALLVVAEPDTPEYILYASLMAVLVGLIKLALGVLQQGYLVYFVADSVIVGFTAGAGILIIVNQLKHVLRVQIPNTPSFPLTMYYLFPTITTTHLITLGLGVLTMVLIVLIKRFRPKWPNALLSMVITSFVVFAFNLNARGVITLGELPRALPPLSRPPLFDLNVLEAVFSGAFAIALMGLIEASAISRTIATESGEHLDNNQEFVGQGLASFFSGFLSGFPSSGSLSRTVVNYDAGAQTRMAAILSGVLIAVLSLVFAPLATYLPRAALSGLLIITGWNLINREEMVRIWRSSRGDSLIMMATFAATLLIPLRFAVVAGVAVSFLRYIRRTSTPDVPTVLPNETFEHFTISDDRPVCPQLGVLTIQGSLYFGSVHHIEERIRANLEENPEQKFLLLRMQHVNHCDVTGIHLLESIMRLYRGFDGDLFLMNVRTPVLELMHDTQFDVRLGDDHFLPTERAIAYLFNRVLDPVVCVYSCKVRAWRECQNLPKAEGAELETLIRLDPDEEVPTMSVRQLYERIQANDPPFIIDVREPTEWQQMYIASSQLIPLPKFFQRRLNLPPGRDVVFVCRSGRRSRQVTGLLRKQGWTNVYNLRGGLLSWQSAELPLVTPDLPETTTQSRETS